MLVLSVDYFNSGPADLIVVLPLTSTQRDIPLHVKIRKGDGGIRNNSAILCDAIRSISKDRLVSRWGVLSREGIAEVEDRMRILARSLNPASVGKPAPVTEICVICGRRKDQHDGLPAVTSR